MRAISTQNLTPTEQEEITLYELGLELSASLGQSAAEDLVIRMALKCEADLRSRFDDSSHALRLLDRYREEVRLGQREPLP